MGWFRPIRRHQLNVTFKISVASVATTGTVYLALAGSGVIHGHPVPEVLAIGVDAVVSLGASVRAAYYEAIEPDRRRREESVRQALEAAWVAVHKCTGIEMVDLLVSCFAVEGFGRRQHLARQLRVGVMQIPRSNVRWEKGKGVVGQCWATEATVRKNLTDLNQRQGTCSRPQWETLSPTKRMGMSYDDWVKTRRKYDMIIAVPIHENNQFVGCVALTGPQHNSTWLQKPEVEQALVAAAATIGKTG